MPDMDKFGERFTQIQMLTNLMSSMPPQLGQNNRIPFPRAKAQQWATELVNVHGARVHPELAADIDGAAAPASDAVAAAFAGAGLFAAGVGAGAPIARQRTVTPPAMDAPGLLNVLRSFPQVPSLKIMADEIQAVLGDPEAEAALLKDFSKRYPGALNTARQLAAKWEAEKAAAEAAPESAAQQ
jgi:hypothetical protein